MSSLYHKKSSKGRAVPKVDNSVSYSNSSNLRAFHLSTPSYSAVTPVMVTRWLQQFQVLYADYSIPREGKKLIPFRGLRCMSSRLLYLNGILVMVAKRTGSRMRLLVQILYPLLCSCVTLDKLVSPGFCLVIVASSLVYYGNKMS